MLKNVFAGFGVFCALAWIVLASPALGHLRRPVLRPAAITDPHFMVNDVWHPDTKSIA